MKPMNDCFTWKNATYAAVGALLLAGSALAWVDATKVDLIQYQSMEDDIRIIKECLIQKKC